MMAATINKLHLAPFLIVLIGCHLVLPSPIDPVPKIINGNSNAILPTNTENHNILLRRVKRVIEGNDADDPTVGVIFGEGDLPRIHYEPIMLNRTDQVHRTRDEIIWGLIYQRVRQKEKTGPSLTPQQEIICNILIQRQAEQLPSICHSLVRTIVRSQIGVGGFPPQDGSHIHISGDDSHVHFDGSPPPNVGGAGGFPPQDGSHIHISGDDSHLHFDGSTPPNVGGDSHVHFDGSFPSNIGNNFHRPSQSNIPPNVVDHSHIHIQGGFPPNAQAHHGSFIQNTVNRRHPSNGVHSRVQNRVRRPPNAGHFHVGNRARFPQATSNTGTNREVATHSPPITAHSNPGGFRIYSG